MKPSRLVVLDVACGRHIGLVLLLEHDPSKARREAAELVFVVCRLDALQAKVKGLLCCALRVFLCYGGDLA